MAATGSRKGARLGPPAASKPSTSNKPSNSPANSTVSAVPHEDSEFPLTQYASVLGVRLMLIGFTVLYLPRMTCLFTPLATRKMTDGPQSDFMEALTADLTSTLCWISAGLALVEVWWAGWMRTWFFNQTVKGAADEIKVERMRFDELRFVRMKDAIALTALAALAAHIVIVAFGAPIATHILQTALLASVLSILTVFTPTVVLGPPSLASDTPSLIHRLAWTRLFVERSPRNVIERAFVYSVTGTFIGAWVGAIPIALDWDRPWQVWPLTPLFGGVGGYIIGALSAFALSTIKYLAEEHIRSQQLNTKAKTH